MHGKIAVVLFASSALAGCVSSGFHAGARGTAPVDDGSVAIVETGPSVPDGGKIVSGTSCMNLITDPAPTDEMAISVLKREARKKGFNAIHSVETRSDEAALAKNCWSAKVATGIAFNLPTPPSNASSN